MQTRLAAASVLRGVREGASLSRALPRVLAKCPPETHATVQALSYGVLRQYEQIEALLGLLLRKPLKRKDRIVTDLLQVALFELLDAETPDYAVVDSTVNLIRQQRSWAAGMGNAVLRRFQREREALLQQVMAQPAACYLLPDWLAGKLRKAWPDDFDVVAAAMSRPAAMTVRIDLNRCRREDYLHDLQAVGIGASLHPIAPAAIVLDSPADVTCLPGFESGVVSVQDAAAQLAAALLDPQPGQQILDACAAPGGKTVHLLEATAGKAAITAVESEPQRVGRLRDNLVRSGYEASVVTADAGAAASWSDGDSFDRILLDAPCSATGVIRRHPDIKRHRQPSDVKALVTEQRRLLEQLWPLLKPGGLLLYATCSVLPEENSKQVERFLAEVGGSVEQPIDANWGRACRAGRQILPGEHGMDGFYYARLLRQGD